MSIPNQHAKDPQEGEALEQWRRKEIEAGITDAEADRTIEHDRVKAMAASWRSQPRYKGQ